MFNDITCKVHHGRFFREEFNSSRHARWNWAFFVDHVIDLGLYVRTDVFLLDNLFDKDSVNIYIYIRNF